jgi:hypothetical protein
MGKNKVDISIEERSEFKTKIARDTLRRVYAFAKANDWGIRETTDYLLRFALSAHKKESEEWTKSSSPTSSASSSPIPAGPSSIATFLEQTPKSSHGRQMMPTSKVRFEKD